MNQNQIAAKELFEMLIKNQPQMFSSIHISGSSGTALANFCTDFIQQYSENLEKIKAGPSPGKLA